jgi:serine/threonine protein kinase
MRKIIANMKKNSYEKSEMEKEKFQKDPTVLYEKIRKLDEGATGKVYLCMEMKLKRRVAIKIIEKDEKLLNFYYNEISILSQFSHPGIIQYYDSHLTTSQVWIVLEYMEGGKLTDWIEKKKKFSEEEISNICLQLLQSLKYLHENEIIHRDVKSDNILLAHTQGDILVKLCDFGFSCKLKDLKENYLCGSPYWMAPELCLGKKFNMKVDVWALGITAMELAQGEPPHMEFSMHEVLRKIPREESPTLKRKYI